MRVIKIFLLGLVVGVGLLLVVMAQPIAPVASAPAPSTVLSPDEASLRDAVVVGSNWDGTAEVFDPESYEIIARYNLVPDLDQRFAEINDSWRRRIEVRFIRHVVGEGNDQLVDDLFPSRDGRYLYISRPSLALSLIHI